MKTKNIILVFFVFIASLTEQFIYSQHAESSQEKPHIIILNLSSSLWSGITTHVLNMYKTLVKNNYPIVIYSNKTSRLDQALRQINGSIKFDSELQSDLENLYKKNKQIVLLCNKREDLVRAQKIKRIIPIKIVFFQHMDDLHNIHDVQDLKNLDCIVGINQHLADSFNTLNTEHNLTIKKIAVMQPFFDEERFLNFRTLQTQSIFFKQEFNIDTQGLPVLCSIGNMYSNLSFKNHPLLFKAIRTIIHEKKKPVHLVLVGSGSRMDYLKKMARELEINKFVHFVGFSPKIPDILHHCDFHVLASSNESFGIVHLEAALMKKPSIGATGTGAEIIIKNENTGLLFKNNDEQDLTQKIELLIDNPVMRKFLGENAYLYVQEKFSNDSNFLKLEKLLQFSD